MNSETALTIVQSGLERRKNEQAAAAKEEKLEAYEKQMICHCNEHCADMKAIHKMEETARLNREKAEIRRIARKEALEAELAREKAATDAVKRYIFGCMAIIILTIITKFPMWAAVTLDVGLAVFPAAYAFRLWFPLED